MPINHTELARFVEYLQRSLLKDGTEAIFNNELHQENATKGLPYLRQLAADDEVIDQYVRRVLDFQPETAYETVHSHHIFRPILDEALTTAREAGFTLKKPVTISDSTLLEVSPLSRPSQDVHIILAGRGTYAFCNYWAKALTLFIHGAEPVIGRGVWTPADIAEAFRQQPVLLLAPLRLAVYQALTGSLIGFGRLASPNEQLAFRMELVNAMETFVIAHELAHCIADEADEKYRGCLQPDDAFALELLCDKIGLLIARNVGTRKDNWSSFSGVGALLFFRFTQIGEIIRGMLQVNEQPYNQSETHPDTTTRIGYVRERIVSGTAPENTEAAVSYFDQLDNICSVMFRFILRAVAGSDLMETKSG